MAAKETWQSATLLEKQVLGNSYFLMSLQMPPPFTFQAGQHVTLRFSDALGEMKCHYSIASKPDHQGVIDLCIAFDTGSRTYKVFAGLQPGEKVEVAGPFGQFVLAKKPQAPLVFIAGGSGISPLRSMIQTVYAQTPPYPKPVELLYGCRQENAFPFRDEFQNLAKVQKGFTATFCADEPATGTVKKGLVTDFLKQVVGTGKQYFICGPYAMVEAVRALLAASGVRKDDIFFERY